MMLDVREAASAVREQVFTKPKTFAMGVGLPVYYNWI